MWGTTYPLHTTDRKGRITTTIEENHNMNDDFPLSKLGRDYVLWRLARIDEKLDLLAEVAIRL